MFLSLVKFLVSLFFWVHKTVPVKIVIRLTASIIIHRFVANNNTTHICYINNNGIQKCTVRCQDQNWRLITVCLLTFYSNCHTACQIWPSPNHANQIFKLSLERNRRIEFGFSCWSCEGLELQRKLSDSVKPIDI